jgi:hypothetical protein
MEPHPSLDVFWMREIEQQLTADLQRDRAQLQKATTEEKKHKHSALALRDRVLQRLRDLVAQILQESSGRRLSAIASQICGIGSHA